MHRGFFFQIDIRDLPFRFTHYVHHIARREEGGGGGGGRAVKKGASYSALNLRFDTTNLQHW